MNVPTADELAESQAALNEYLANMIMGEAFNELRYGPRGAAERKVTLEAHPVGTAVD